ncbi:MAG: competence/damage-inducible protein A [Oscillospiraceae bacterium]|nr:competence/damage-inducible protein A [Oscillospiraceae bacterium]
MSNTAELIAVGTELLLGNIANTDAQMLSKELSALGINVYYHTVVGDNPERLGQAVNLAKSRADIIITTGGLGPTYDDLTKNVLADTFGKKLVFHEDSAARIRDYFMRMKREMTENNLLQAMLPEGCTVFDNDWGTAPGCAFEADGVCVIMLPGPPQECAKMFQHRAAPYLQSRSDGLILSRSLRIFGMGEAAVEAQLHDKMNRMTNPTLAPYAKPSEVELRITARADTEEEARRLIAPVEAELREELGELIYGADVNSLEEAILPLLQERGMTFGCAESCTGGLIAERFTACPGASAVFNGGIVSYSNDVKQSLLNVSSDMLAAHGAVSAPVAESMAQGARRALGCDLAIAATGVAGPDSDARGTPVGTVFVALASPTGIWVRELTLGFGRDRIRTLAASYAFDMARRYLCALPIV